MNDRQLAINNQAKIEPLSRLVVRDGLLLNAERWRQAHQYHRQRQNLHYQSLHRPGIVYGLGVKAISPPRNIPAQYRQEKRWLQIQPGMAIDDWGNPIIVTEAINLRLAAYPQKSITTAYLVISYVDPDRLESIQETEFVPEMFRIEEKLSLPAPGEIELCRIKLQSEVIEVTNPQNSLFPLANQLDLRDRPIAEVKPPKSVQVAQITTANPINFNWQYLFRSLDALYPAMSCASEVMQVNLANNSEQILDCDLLWLTQQQLHSLQSAELERLGKYLAAGCVVTIEIPSHETTIGELGGLKHKLSAALTDAKSLNEFPDIPQQIEAELQACEAKLAEQVAEITTAIADVFPQLKNAQNSQQQSSSKGIVLDKDVTEITDAIADFIPELNQISEANSGKIGHNHPLRNQPFLFAQFPIVNEQLIQVFNWRGIVLVIGDLSAAWGLDPELKLSRESIRTAQEMGINLLHFAWQRKHLTRLMQ